MKLITCRSVDIVADPAAVWSVISDIENAANNISAIKRIEVLESSNDKSIVGVKWKETREWMGRDVVEVMWITDAENESFYETRAESHGCIYKSRLELEKTPSGTKLSMAFHCHPNTIGAKIMWLLTGWMAKNSLSKAIDQDLTDIKQAADKISI